MFSWSRGIYPPSLIFPEAFAFGDGLSLLFGEAGLGAGRLFAKRKPCTQGFARETCGFRSTGVQTPPRAEPLHLEKTRPSLLPEAVFPPALS